MEELGLASDISARGQMGKIIRVDDEVAEKITLGQLYGMLRYLFSAPVVIQECLVKGMCDALTNSLVERVRSTVPFVIKYVGLTFYL